MTSVTNSSGLNYQNGINPLGRKVRALEADVDMLKRELNLLKNGGVTASSSVVNIPPTLTADVDLLKRDVSAIKMAGYGKGERGDKGEKGERGEKGDKGDRGETGPMTYIAMPANATLPVAPSATS